jgi:hypothetical protein
LRKSSVVSMGVTMWCLFLPDIAVFAIELGVFRDSP